MFLVILLYALFASLFAFSKGTLEFSEPFFLIGSRMTFAGLLLLLHQFIWNRKAFQFKKEHIKYLFLLGFLCIYVTNVAEIWGIQHMVSAKACLIYSLSPFLGAAIAYIVLGETLNAKKWLGFGIGVLGLIPTFMARTQSEITAGNLAFISLPEIAMLIAVVGSVYGWTLLKKVVQEYEYSPLMANGISMTLGGIMALIHSYVSGETWSPIPVTDFGLFLRNSLGMCLISNIICYNLYGYLLKRYTATFMSFAGLITPFFASFFGWVFLGETITWHFFVAVAIFSVGLTIFYNEELKRDKVYVKPNIDGELQKVN
jgi:drug/metabolite transporter (DMT)-like permease